MSVVVSSSTNITELFQLWAVWDFLSACHTFVLRSNAFLLISLRTRFSNDVDLKTDVFSSTFQQLHLHTFHLLYFHMVLLFLFAPYLSHLHTQLFNSIYYTASSYSCSLTATLLIFFQTSIPVLLCFMPKFIRNVWLQSPTSNTPSKHNSPIRIVYLFCLWILRGISNTYLGTLTMFRFKTADYEFDPWNLIYITLHK